MEQDKSIFPKWTDIIFSIRLTYNEKLEKKKRKGKKRILQFYSNSVTVYPQKIIIFKMKPIYYFQHQTNLTLNYL